MVQHRCTRCKEDVGEFGTRHKYAQGLFCEPCLKALRVRGGIVRKGGGFLGGFWSRLWDIVADLVTAPFKSELATKSRDRTMRVAYNVIKNKARDIPADARTMGPQKR